MWRVLWLGVAFAVGGSLPLWHVWFWDGSAFTHAKGSLWSLVAHLPETGFDKFLYRHDDNLARLVVLMAVAGGPLIVRLLKRPAVPSDLARDYADRPSGPPGA